MKELLKENIKEIEKCFRKQKLVDDFEDEEKSEIYTTLKRDISLTRRVKKEGNFSYIYYEISNFDRLLNGKLKVIQESVPQLCIVESRKEYLCLINEYLLLYKDVPFTLKVEQSFLGLEVFTTNTHRDDSNLFNLPVFCTDVFEVYITENGVTEKLIYKQDTIEEQYINSLNNGIGSEYMYQAIEGFNIKVFNERIFSPTHNIKIYYNDKLELNKYQENVIDCIRGYLEYKYYNGYITKRDFTFNQKIEEYIDKKDIKAIDVIFEYLNSYVETSEFFCIKTYMKKVKDTLTNNSKIKIVITKEESCLFEKEMSLKDFICNVILKSRKIYIRPTSKYVDLQSLLDVNNNQLCSYKKDYVPTVCINFRVIDNICYPNTKINICKENFKKEFIDINQELLEEKISYNKKKSEILLTQYYLVEIPNERENKISYIFRIKFKFRKVSFKYLGKTFVLVIPYLLNDEMYKMELFDEQKTRLLQSNMAKDSILNYVYKISNFEVLDFNTHIIKRCVLQIYPDIKNLGTLKALSGDNLFSDKNITFFKKEQNCVEFNLNRSYIDFYELDEYYEKVLEIYKIK